MDIEVLKKILLTLNSKLVSKATVGGGAGSIIQLGLETNDYFFFYCIWRLEYNGIVLSTSDDDNTPITGLMAKTIKELERKRLMKIDVSPQLDLILFFENNYVLKIFCNMSYTSGDYSNWELCSPDNDIVYTVNNMFKMETDTYH